MFTTRKKKQIKERIDRLYKQQKSIWLEMKVLYLENNIPAYNQMLDVYKDCSARLSAARKLL